MTMVASPRTGRPGPLRSALLAAATSSAVLIAPLQAAHAQDGGAAPVTIRDTEIEETLHQECDPVFIAAGLDPKQVNLLIIQGEFNAVTLNAQTMGVGTDLIERTDTPNELEGVMAHETGHAAGGHIERSGELQKAGLAPFLLTLGLGILAAAAGAPDAGAALAGSSGYFGTLGALGYSRQTEARADQAALTYLDKAHESAKGMVDFFDAFRYEEVFDEARRFPYFQSHPISSERIELVRRRAESLPDYNKPDSPELIVKHEIMKAKLKAFTDPPQQTFLAYPPKDTSFVGRYARAIAYYKETETASALQSIAGLIADYPNNPYLWELKGQVLFESGRSKEAEAAHRRSVELKPNAPLLRVNLAQAILAEQDPKRDDEAIAELQKALMLEKDNAFAWRLMAQAYDAKGEGGAARLASAEEFFSIGDMTQARIFALRARELLKHNTPQWRRATDIVLTSNPSRDDLRVLQSQAGVG